MIKLRKLELKDAKGMLEWMHDEELMKNFRFNGTHMKQDQAESFIVHAQNDEVNKHYAVVADDNEYLGTISLKSIDAVSKNGEYSIAMRKKAIGTGAAIEATRQILEVAFHELGLEKVYLNVLAENKRAIRFYEKLGFIKEGEFKKHVYSHGRLNDLWWYAIFNGGCRE
ncbi:GNAT family N-acetyltransferase [Bacillus sp. OK048]|uniref:GNAT family N-acetyltransferase n=1 Tax=Bacillus sp. OK048 TaxID=1882761 RepID=UPI00088D316B|nr:GNAT family protein [Bacillus sp. OK048]SDM69820.1 diamine N-acetyltransferase [Bacillus sp. OK048]